MLYHQTKDAYYLNDFLEHKELVNIETYVNSVSMKLQAKSDESTVKIAEKPEDTKAFLYVGFEGVCRKDDWIFSGKCKRARNAKKDTKVSRIAAGVSYLYFWDIPQAIPFFRVFR